MIVISFSFLAASKMSSTRRLDSSYARSVLLDRNEIIGAEKSLIVLYVRRYILCWRLICIALSSVIVVDCFPSF